MDSRPDLKEAEQSLEKARTDHQLAISNGSADPTFSVDVSHQPDPLNTYRGASVSFRCVFSIGIRVRSHTRSSTLDGMKNCAMPAQLAALHDVDSAYATSESTLKLLRPYKTKYLQEAQDIRSSVSFAYLHGAASLLDFLDAQKQLPRHRTELSESGGRVFFHRQSIEFCRGVRELFADCR